MKKFISVVLALTLSVTAVFSTVTAFVYAYAHISSVRRSGEQTNT